MSTCSIPKCLKSAIIVPIPKKSAVSSLIGYRPVAFTSTVMKCFERLQLNHIKASLPFHPHWTSTSLPIKQPCNRVLTHLEHPGTYARLLFVDFSSAFNCIFPGRLESNLHGLGISTNICRWFLTDCPQSVHLGSQLSSVLTLSTGAPHTHETNTFIKFADDTTIVGLIHNNDVSAYRD